MRSLVVLALALFALYCFAESLEFQRLETRLEVLRTEMAECLE